MKAVGAAWLRQATWLHAWPVVSSRGRESLAEGVKMQASGGWLTAWSLQSAVLARWRSSFKGVKH